jgi:prepilin-type N-terminal cleavage/methylation domain-containing protein
MNRPGFSLTEVIVVIGISGVIMVILMRFTAAGWDISRETRLQQNATEDARLQLERIAKSMREARIADTGAYPLVVMSPQRMDFYSDVDADDATELVRYELVGTTLRRGVTQPTGNPVTYNQAANEVTTDVAHSIRNGNIPLFTYYSGDYPADQTPLSPIDLTEVKYIQFHLIVDSDPAVDPAPVDIISQVQLRNLKANLGDTE